MKKQLNANSFSPTYPTPWNSVCLSYTSSDSLTDIQTFFIHDQKNRKENILNDRLTILALAMTLSPLAPSQGLEVRLLKIRYNKFVLRTFVQSGRCEMPKKHSYTRLSMPYFRLSGAKLYIWLVNTRKSHTTT